MKTKKNEAVNVMADNLTENLFEHYYPDLSIPKLWQIIYQEGVIGNHILFADEDITEFKKESFSTERIQKIKEYPMIEDIVFSLLSANCLSQMKTIITACAFEMRCYLFFLYLWFLKTVNFEVKASLN